MNKIERIVALIFVITLISCQPKEKKEGKYNILPMPHEYAISGVSNLRSADVQSAFSPTDDLLPITGDILEKLENIKSESEAQIVYKIDTDLDIKEEGYHLNISEDKINIAAKDKAGLLYGFMTMEQLLEDAKEQQANLPICAITDFPALSYRAIHLDIKHHLEKKEYYYRLMDKLAHYKVNAIILEAEDKIKYKRQPLVGSADALSIDDWKELSNYAKERNIEISPLIQGLGHASFVLKHDEYSELRDDPKSDWAFNPLDPKTYDVQFDLYLDAIEATPDGKYLHIGGDEVHTTGRNSGKSSLELQLDWLGKVCKFADEHNRIPIFWDDMPLKHAGVYRPMFDTKISAAKVDSIWEKNEQNLSKFLDVFPKNCIYMRWNYRSPETYGNGKAMEWFVENDLQVMGATAGQTRWVLMPQNQSNMPSIKSFATSSIASGLNGLLLTLWDDDSPHFELYMRGIVSFAEYTWSGEKRSLGELKAAYRQREFSTDLAEEAYNFVDDLETPVAQWKNLLLADKVSRNNLVSSKEPKDNLIMDFPSAAKGEWSKKYADRVAQAKATLKTSDSITTIIVEMKKKAIRNVYNLDVYEQVNKLVAFSNNALLALNAYDVSETKAQESAALAELKQLELQFKNMRSSLEEVYGRTRILTKPGNYILDQDHHVHLANQTISFDWQFMAEIFFLDKLKNHIANSGFERESKMADK